MKLPDFSWDEKTNTATCTIFDNNLRFTGKAICHPTDEDMASPKTGQEIALRRANIKYLKHVINNILKPELNALTHFYHTINQSKKFNKDSYENRMLQRQIRIKTLDLDTVKEELAVQEQSLKDYIKRKDEFYQKTRNGRAYFEALDKFKEAMAKSE